MLTENDIGDLQFLAGKWLSLPDKAAASAFYESHVFPEVLAQVVPRERDRLGLLGEASGYPVMMLTLGTSPEPLVISLSVWRPAKALILATEETAPLLQWIQNRIPANSRIQIELRIVDKVDPTYTYREMKDAFQRWSSPNHGAVDVTGGTKAMTSGATQAAGILGFDVVYIESDYDKELRRPKPGSERTSRLANPLQVMGDLERKQALTLAGRGEYQGAAAILQSLAERVPGDGAIVCATMANLARAYAAFDTLDLEEADRWLADTRKLLRQHGCPGGIAELATLTAKENVLARQEKAIATLTAGLPKKAEAISLEQLKNQEFMSFLTGVICHQALRREGEGRLDMAALLWYRLLEMMEQSCLATLGLDTAKPDYDCLAASSGFTLLDIEHEYVASRKKIGYGGAELPSPVSLVDGYLLLAAAGNGLYPELSRLANLVGLRNFSIYAHGYAFIPRKHYDSFRSLTEEVLKNFVEVTAIDRAAWDELAFISLD